HRAGLGIGFELAPEPLEVGHQREVEQVHRRMVERHRGDASLAVDRERRVLRAAHGRGLTLFGAPGPAGPWPGRGGGVGPLPSASPIQAACRSADEARMLLCKSCNTRFEDGKSACPSCGRRIFVSLKETPKPGDSGSMSLSGAVSTAA